MKHQQQSKRKISPVQVIRAVIQLIAFILIPGFFITVFSAIGSIFTSIIGGTFEFSEQMANIFMLLAVFLITFIWGRFFCGFICSFGAMQDLLWFFGKRIPFRPVISQKGDRVLKLLKYGVLLFIVFGVWVFAIPGDTVWSPWTVFGMYTSPVKGFSSELMFLSIGGALLLVIIIGSLFVERFFCKYLCPLGALFALASRFRIFKLKRDSSQCSGRCRVCTRKCSMSIPLYKYDSVNSGECINCMKCSSVCALGNIKADTIPAVTGTVAAIALTGVAFAGTLQPAKTTSVSVQAPISVSFSATSGRFKDGSYTGSAAGFRGTTSVTVKVENGIISDITVDSTGDDKEFFNKAQSGVISSILAAQSTNVDTVSGATYSSKVIINAVENALGDQLIQGSTKAEETTQAEQSNGSSETRSAAQTEPGDEQETQAQENSDNNAFEGDTESQQSKSSNGSFADGTYTGSGSGFRGTTSVSVTVQNGAITDITVTSYQDDYPFFSRAESGVISEILSSQSIDVSTVSGATFSSNSIIEAVANALDQEFSNSNSSMGGGHGRH